MMHTLLKNAGNRHAFEGVSEFYEGLQAGPDGEGYNPFFYVSNSPWNLYDLLLDFLHLNQLPRGPSSSATCGCRPTDTVQSYKTHKATWSTDSVYLPSLTLHLTRRQRRGRHRHLPRSRPQQPRTHPVHLHRDVQHEQRARRIEDLIEDVSTIQVKLVGSYKEAGVHARGMGWIV